MTGSDFSSNDYSSYLDNLESYSSSANQANQKYSDMVAKLHDSDMKFNTLLQTPLQTVGSVFVAKGIGRGTAFVKKRLIKALGNTPQEAPEAPEDIGGIPEEANDAQAVFRPGGNIQEQVMEGDPEEVAGGDMDIEPDAGVVANDAGVVQTGVGEGAEAVEAGEGAEAGAGAVAETAGTDALDALATADVAQGGMDIATDIATGVVGLGLLLGGVFGAKHSKPPPPPSPINPSFQAGQ